MDLHIFAEKRGEPTKYNLIKQSFGVNITLRETKKYYNNSEEPSIEKLELNCYESAFFYLGLTDYIPSKYFLATKHNAKKIENDKIEQIFMANHFFETGKSEMNYNNVKINIYNKERMLIELIRNKNTMPFDYYKEIISNYREIADEIDMSLLADYLDCFTNGKRIFEIIHREVF